MAKKDMGMEASEIVDDGGSEPRVYELGFHLDPELSSEEVKNAYEAIRGIIVKNSTMVAEGEPQMIQLAYTISRQGSSDAPTRRDFNSAYFCWIVYEAPAENHAEIVSAANADKRIIRFINLLTTKDVARHSVEIREIALKASERAKEPEEETVGADLDAALEHAVV